MTAEELALREGIKNAVLQELLGLLDELKQFAEDADLWGDEAHYLEYKVSVGKADEYEKRHWDNIYIERRATKILENILSRRIRKLEGI